MVLDLPPRKARAARRARLALKYGTVEICQPRHCSTAGLPKSMTLQLVEVEEINPPPGATAIHWRLLTTHAVTTVAEAHQIVAWYCQRWRIEEYGCEVVAYCADVGQEEELSGLPEKARATGAVDCIVRDVRDYCLSIQKAGGKDMLRAAQRWVDRIDAIAESYWTSPRYTGTFLAPRVSGSSKSKVPPPLSAGTMSG